MTKKKKRANVAAKTKRYVCAKIGHAWPSGDPAFPRCQRCGEYLR